MAIPVFNPYSPNCCGKHKIHGRPNVLCWTRRNCSWSRRSPRRQDSKINCLLIFTKFSKIWLSLFLVTFVFHLSNLHSCNFYIWCQVYGESSKENSFGFFSLRSNLLLHFDFVQPTSRIDSNSHIQRKMRFSLYIQKTTKMACRLSCSVHGTKRYRTGWLTSQLQNICTFLYFSKWIRTV